MPVPYSSRKRCWAWFHQADRYTWSRGEHGLSTYITDSSSISGNRSSVLWTWLKDYSVRSFVDIALRLGLLVSFYLYFIQCRVPLIRWLLMWILNIVQSRGLFWLLKKILKRWPTPPRTYPDSTDVHPRTHYLAPLPFVGLNKVRNRPTAMENT